MIHVAVVSGLNDVMNLFFKDIIHQEYHSKYHRHFKVIRVKVILFVSFVLKMSYDLFYEKCCAYQEVGS